MALTEERTPYEFLARWDRDGKLSAAHVAFRTVIKRDGAVVSEVAEGPQPVSIGKGAGFPLADLLDQVHITAVTKVEELNAVTAGLQEIIAEQKKDIDSLRAALAEANKPASE